MMFTMPVYDMMLLPGVTFYFKKDIFQQMGNQDAKAGDDVLFLMQRSDKDRKDLTAEDLKKVTAIFKQIYLDDQGKEFPQNPKEQLLEALRTMGLSETVRGEALTLEQFASLADLLKA